MQSCSKSDGPSTNTNTGGGGYNTGGGGGNNTSTVDFSIDISKSPFDALKTNGGFYVDPTTKIIIVKTNISPFEIIAVSSICTHQQASIVYQANNSFYCAAHGSVFTTTGSVTTGPATTALKKYQTTLTGTILRIFS
ncbi:MAG: Rieske (2Fe-2S) protein [Chitinophagaceae bacterium]|nr:Rieske (2Fe-2S) protein [Chitinophagaceae bacterium]